SPASSNRAAANRSRVSSRDRAVIREVSKAAWTAELDADRHHGWPRRLGGGLFVWGWCVTAPPKTSGPVFFLANLPFDFLWPPLAPPFSSPPLSLSVFVHRLVSFLVSRPQPPPLSLSLL